MEEVENRLRNLYTTYMFRNSKESVAKLSRVDRLRWLGGMEALLQCLGHLPSGIPFQQERKKKKFLFVPYFVEESYEEYVLRHTLKFLKESPNTPPTTFK